MTAAPAPIARPLAGAPRSVVRISSSEIGPIVAATAKPRPKPRSAEPSTARSFPDGLASDQKENGPAAGDVLEQAVGRIGRPAARRDQTAGQLAHPVERELCLGTGVHVFAEQ